MDPKLKDELSELATKAENCIASSTLPLPPFLHVECLTGNMGDIAKKLRELIAAN